MGRTNGKLVDFLTFGLMNYIFKNLWYDSEDFSTFVIELPRFEKNKDLQDHEKILKEWYRCNGKIHLYKSYSNAKAVFQAALKKSIYLVSLKKDGKKLKYRFATKEEAEAKRLMLKEKSNEQDPNLLKHEEPSMSPSPPPSEASSGYHSGNEGSPIPSDDMEETFLADELGDIYQFFNDKCLSLNSNLFDDILMDQTEDPNVPVNNSDDLAKPPVSEVVQESQPLISEVAFESQPLIGEVACQSQPLIGEVAYESQPLMCPVQSESLPLPVPVEHKSKPVLELIPIPVENSNISKKTFWRCNYKIIIKAILLLICDKEVLEDQNNTINEGQIFIPNEVWEPGLSYKLLKSFEAGEKNFVFFSQN